MAPKARSVENRALPAGWRHKHGAYYYRPPVNLRGLWDGRTEYRLGTSLSEAYRTWAAKLELFTDAKLMADLLDRYALEVIPTKAPKTQQSNQISVRKLRSVFGHMKIAEVRPVHVYKYLDERGRQGKTAANHDVSMLSHAFTKAIEWGLIDNHPIKGKVRKHSTPPRKRYVEDWEVNESLTVASPFLTAYVRLKLLTGLRKSDLLSIKIADLGEDGIYIKPRKTAFTTGKSLIIQWSTELKEAVNQVRALSKKVHSIWLFHTRKGQPYVKEDGTTYGFDSVWQRFMTKAVRSTTLEIKFTEHDLRAKVASDIDLENAKSLLGHSSAEVTERVYRRRPNIVKPTR